MKKILFISTLLFAQPAKADQQQQTEEKKVVYKQKTEIDFEGLDVNAALVKPAGSLVIERKQASFNPLIKLRTNFNQEIEQSVQDIK
jgi:hypothetical protein